jgi:hypothetical protein
VNVSYAYAIYTTVSAAVPKNQPAFEVEKRFFQKSDLDGTPEQGFRLAHALTLNPRNRVATVDPADPNHTFTGLTNGTLYAVGVAANNQYGASSSTVQVGFTTPTPGTGLLRRMVMPTPEALLRSCDGAGYFILSKQGRMYPSGSATDVGDVTAGVVAVR